MKESGGLAVIWLRANFTESLPYKKYIGAALVKKPSLYSLPFSTYICMSQILVVYSSFQPFHFVAFPVL